MARATYIIKKLTDGPITPKDVPESSVVLGFLSPIQVGSPVTCVTGDGRAFRTTSVIEIKSGTLATGLVFETLNSTFWVQEVGLG
jgi:hypothetical protein